MRKISLFRFVEEMSYLDLCIFFTQLCQRRVRYGPFSCCDPYRFISLVLLNPDIHCLCKQCRSRSVGFKMPTDLDLHCLSLSIQICINNVNQVI